MGGRSIGVQCALLFLIHICMSKTFIIPFRKKGLKENQGSYNYNILCSAQGGNSFEIKASLDRLNKVKP